MAGLLAEKVKVHDGVAPNAPTFLGVLAHRRRVYLASLGGVAGESFLVLPLALAPARPIGERPSFVPFVVWSVATKHLA